MNFKKKAMKQFLICLTFILFTIPTLMSQADIDYFHTIPEMSEKMSASSVLARTIDGLGFRYYHATDDLTVTDLEYTSGNGGRMVIELLQHIYSLSVTINNSIHNVPNSRPEKSVDAMTYEQLRAQTLTQLKEARNKAIALTDQQLEESQIKFERAGEVSAYPMWNLFNGPLADAMWHTGQIVSHRRASGNPINSKISLFSGTVRD